MLDDPQCKAEILARIQSVRPEAARRWGRMTAPQMVCHLSDCFLGVMGDRPLANQRGFSWWRLTKPFALHVPMHWPKGVPTRPEIDQQRGGTPPAEFGADVNHLGSLIERFTEKPRAFEFHPHPLFGVMSEMEWMRWGYLHCDHHLRQFGR